MISLREIWFRLRKMSRMRTNDEEMSEEFRQHLEMRIERNIANGMSADDARRSAVLAFGGMEQIKERARDQRSLVPLEQLLNDFRFALRSLRKASGFALATILILAVGIGANATLFSWIRPFLFDLLPGTTAPERIVAIESLADGGSRGREPLTTSFLDFRDLRDLLKLVDVVGINQGALAVGIDRATESTWCELVSGNFFDVMGVRPLVGRFFSPNEQTDAQNGSPVAIISYSYWRVRYHADPSAIGSNLRINGVPFTIIGVAPEQFHGTQTGLAYQIWLPLTMYGSITHTGTWMLDDRRTRNFTMLARLHSGVTIDQAQSEVDTLTPRMAKANVDDVGVGATVLPLTQWNFGPQSTLLKPLKILSAACTVLLLIVCANVANLQLARTMIRQKEFSVRLALGCSRGRLARLLLIESLVLTMTAAVLGLVISQWLGGALHWLLPAVAVPTFILPSLAGGVFIYTFALAVTTALCAGVAPAIHATRTNLNDILSQGGRNSSASLRFSRVRGLFVVTEVALAVVTLITATAFFQSFRSLRSEHPGFSPEGQILAHFNLSNAGYSQAQADLFYQRTAERMRQLPGVTAVSYGDTVPLGFSGGNWEDLEVQGYPPMPGENMKIGRNMIGPGYFEVMKIPFVDGRDFDLRDGPDATPVIIVTQEFVHRFIPHGAAIGRLVRGWGRWRTIVGVVKDIKLHRMGEATLPFFYIPIRQVYRPEYGLTFHVRTESPLPTTLVEIRSLAAAIDPSLPLLHVESMTEYVSGSLYGVKITTTLLCIFGGLGVLLAAMGLYSVTAFSVAQRSYEIAIRTALGAQAFNLFAMVMWEGLRFAITGLVGGSVAAVILMRLASSNMVELHSPTPVVCASIGLSTMILAGIALAIPAGRALRIDPIVSMKNE